MKENELGKREGLEVGEVERFFLFNMYVIIRLVMKIIKRNSGCLMNFILLNGIYLINDGVFLIVVRIVEMNK